MSADGVSLPTTLAQMGSVAKTQAKAQHNAPQVTPFSEQKDQEDDLKVQRVKETEKTDQEKIDPDADRRDRRKRRRLKRNRKQLGREASGESDNGEPGGEDQPDQETLGNLIDLRV